MAQATFSVRMDESLKKQFDILCSEFGMNASTAINIFARAVVYQRRIPFEITAPYTEVTREGAMQAFNIAKQNKSAFLCGTTNLPADFIDALKSEKQIPVFYSANVSIGVFLFGKLLQKAAELYKDYIPQIHEAHHAQKKDAWQIARHLCLISWL